MPNPRLLQTATRLTRKGNRIRNRLLMPYTTKKGDVTLYVLKLDGRSKKYKILAEVQDFGTDVETTQFRSRPYFEVAEARSIFGDNKNLRFGEILAVASHVAIVPNGEIFSIREGDELQVMQTDFTYKIFTQLKGEKFVRSENE